MPPPRKPGQIKDLSQDRDRSKKDVALQRAKLAQDWARRNLSDFVRGAKNFDDKGAVLQKLAALEKKFAEDAETRKKIADQAEELLKQLEKVAKGLARHDSGLKSVSEVKTIGPMPKVAPPGGTELAAALVWVMVWRAWIGSVRKAFK